MQNMDLVQSIQCKIYHVFSVQDKRSEILSTNSLPIKKVHLVQILHRNDSLVQIPNPVMSSAISFN